MAKETLYYRPNGPQLTVEVTCGHAQDGVYDIYLREPGSHHIIWNEEGDFESDLDDRFPLPGKASEQRGRKLHCSCRVVMLGGDSRYAVFMKVCQGDRLLGVVTESGESDASTVPLDLIARLRPEE